MFNIVRYVGENIFVVFIFTLFVLFVIYNLLFLIRVASWAWNSRKSPKPVYTKPFRSIFRRFKSSKSYKSKGRK